MFALAQKEFWKNFWDTIGRGSIWRGEVCNRAKDGSLYWVDSTVIPLKDADGKPRGYLSIPILITDRKRLESELERARDAALESARMKSMFMANMSHEIRTPMIAVLGMAGLLLESDLSPKQRKFAELIEQFGKSLLHIINDILDLSKMESGQFNIEAAEMSLHEVIQSNVQILAHSAEAKGIALHGALSSDIPPLVRGDAVRFGQVLANLIGNAIKFIERGEVRIQADLENSKNYGNHSKSNTMSRLLFPVSTCPMSWICFPCLPLADPPADLPPYQPR